jgi:hypothetical protein
MISFDAQFAIRPGNKRELDLAVITIPQARTGKVNLNQVIAKDAL